MATSASRIMQGLNPYAAHGSEGGREVFFEDVADADGRWYSVEYQCNADGSSALAYLRYNPWHGNPFNYRQSHLGDDGFICYATGLYKDHSPYGLKYAVERVRFWCNGYSFLRENGWEATCREIPEWCSHR